MDGRVVDSFTAWRDDRHFTKNPDMVRPGSGKLLCVFNLTNTHQTDEYTKITLLESRDDGRTWDNPVTVDELRPVKGEERWVTPRLSLLSDGRLVILCDQNDYRHCHESQPPGIYAWWSEDGGKSWSGRQATGIPGIEPDRVREPADGTLIVGSHYMFRETHKLGQVALRSSDGGKSWGSLSVVASDRVRNYCEGAMVPLASGRIACIMRENNHNNYPCYVSFSEDGGETWGGSVEAPFSGDRPFAEQLEDGRVLATFRNQAGRPGTCAWVGDIEAEQGYRVSVATPGPTHQSLPSMRAGEGPQQTDRVGPWDPGAAVLAGGALSLDCSRGTTRYCLLPPENEWSGVNLAASLKVGGPEGQACGLIQIARIDVHLEIAADGLSLGANPHYNRKIDLTGWRDLSLEYRDGKLEVAVDGEVVLRKLVYREALWDRTFVGLAQGARGTLRLKSLSYDVRNPTEPDHRWDWKAASGQLPNQYEMDRWIMLEPNTNPRPDNGYSTWVRMPDGRFLVLDYTNRFAPPRKAYLMGYVLEL